MIKAPMPSTPPPVLPYRSLQRIDWAPPQGVTEHSKQAIPPDAEFFAAPPPEIGEILSAYTTLKTGKRSLSWIVRLAMTAGVIAVLIGIAILLHQGLSGGNRDMQLLVVAMAIILCPAAIPATLISTRFKHTCTFVGEDGIARFTLKGNRERQPKAEIFPFNEAMELRTRQTNHYHNGIYTGTTYHFTWTDTAGKKRFLLKGTHRGKKKGPKPKDPYHFAAAAEIAWSMFLLGRAEAEMQQNGFVHFNIKAGQWVRVGPGFFEFNLNGETQRCETGDIASLKLAGGHFNISHKDAKWFSRKGKFGFDYGNMANAKLFLLAVEKLIGYQFG